LKNIVLLVFILVLNWQQATAQHSLEKLPYPVNSDYLDEICPVLSPDRQLLFFTRMADPDCEKTLIIDGMDVNQSLSPDEYAFRLQKVYSQIANRVIADPLATTYNQDIWYTRLSDGQPVGIYHPGYPINDVLPNSICSGYGTANAYLVINQFEKTGGIDRGFSTTHLNGREFAFPEPLHIERFNKSASELNLTAATDSSVVILAMKDENGYGNMDLYVCFRTGPSAYSQPVNLGPDINTASRESTPVLSSDLKRIYFSSDRPGSYGGTDIYYAQRKDFTFTSWSAPVRLNPPVNSPYDDSHPYLASDDDSFYFTSNRDGTSDIYKARLIRQKPGKEVSVTIKIINGKTGKKSTAELIWGEAYQDLRPGFFRAREGVAKYVFYENKPMAFKAVNRDLFSDEVIIDPQDLINAGETNREIVLIMYGPQRPEPPSLPRLKAEKKNEGLTDDDLNARASLKSIYFERTKPEVLQQSYPVIKQLAEIMLERPRLYILIAGHTDNVGDEAAKQKLSEDRARAIKDLLVQMGVPEDRVDTAGYGDSRPIAPNDTETNKSRNRRVEIKIVSQ